MNFKGALKTVPEDVRLQFGLDLLEAPETEGFWLNFREDELFVEFAGEWSNLHLDFIQVFKDLRSGKGNPKASLIKQALGKKAKLVIDATCGLAGDSLI